MNQRLVPAVLSLSLLGPALPATRAPQDAAPADLAGRVQRAADELAAQGLVVDLASLAVATRPMAECRDAALAELRASFGSERAEAYRLMLQAYGREFASGDELLAEWARARLRMRTVLYRPEARELTLVAENAGLLGEREAELLQGLALAARHQAGATVFESPPGETLDAYLVRRALLTGGAMTDAQRALEARSEDAGFHALQWLHDLELDQLETETWRQGFDLWRGRSAEAYEALWTSLPTSSEQLVHAPKQGQDQPSEVSLPAWPEKLEGARLVFEDTLGEVAIHALLQSHGLGRLRAETTCLGWDGDRLQHYVTAEGEDVLVWRTVWDRPRDAQQFADEWTRRSDGQVLRGGRTVDWVLAGSKGVWNRVLKSLDASPHGHSAPDSDGTLTARLEDEIFESRRSAPYVVGNEWRHPRLDLTVVVPIGWYEDEAEGVQYIVRTKTAGFRDNVQVVSRRTPDADTLDGVLEVNAALLRADEDKELIAAEKRMLGDQEVGFLRYHGDQGVHQVIYSTLILLSPRRQTAVTVAIEEGRWAELHPTVEWILESVRVGPVSPLEE